MQYDKLFGLRHLKKALSGIKGTRVLKWRKYSKPEYFRPSHFSNPERFLIRTNVEGKKLTFGQYALLPRRDASSNVIRTMKEMIDECKRDFPIHFIVHPVRKREDVLFHGKMSFYPTYPSSNIVDLNFPSPKEKTWARIDPTTFALDDKQGMMERLKRRGLNDNNAEKVYASIVNSFHALRSKTSSLLKTGDKWHAEFTIHKDDSTLEFYHFELEPSPLNT